MTHHTDNESWSEGYAAQPVPPAPPPPQFASPIPPVAPWGAAPSPRYGTEQSGPARGYGHSLAAYSATPVVIVIPPSPR